MRNLKLHALNGASGGWFSASIPQRPTGETIMALPEFSMRQLLEACAHFGHQAHRWNRKWPPSFSGSATTSPSSIWPRRCRCCTVRCRKSVIQSPRAGVFLFVGTKRQLPMSLPMRPSAARNIMSIHAGWAACSPTGRQFRPSNPASA